MWVNDVLVCFFKKNKIKINSILKIVDISFKIY